MYVAQAHVWYAHVHRTLACVRVCVQDMTDAYVKTMLRNALTIYSIVSSVANQRTEY